MKIRSGSFLLGVLLFVLAGCANQTTPTGGKKDVTAPKLLEISPADSLRNTHVKRLELSFDEYITVNDVVKEVQISPILSIAPTVTGNNKTVVVKIIDSLLEENTTYRLSFGNAIKDLHEGNPFANYTYTFSTGAYFDSLMLKGKVLNAGTGLPDSAGCFVVLYYKTDNDSAIVRRKPRYITKADAKGNFTFKGLPGKVFRIYAIKDANDNLLYDKGADMVAFREATVTPGDSSVKEIELRMFQEGEDTSKSANSMESIRKTRNEAKAKEAGASNAALNYSVNVDTTNANRRTFDITKALKIRFNATPILNREKISLVYDSSGVAVPQAATIVADTSEVRIEAVWKENTQYTLRLAKGFARDSAGAELMPVKFTFKTKQDDDYGKITIHLPGKYYGKEYILQVVADKDTIYQKPVTDTTIIMTRLAPTRYNFRLIVDENGNGVWDTGDLFGKLQPEVVIPYPGGLFLKPGWENVIDFETGVKK